MCTTHPVMVERHCTNEQRSPAMYRTGLDLHDPWRCTVLLAGFRHGRTEPGMNQGLSHVFQLPG